MSSSIYRVAAGFALAVALTTSTVAHADLSKKVIGAFKGQIVVTAAEVEPASTDKATIDAYKKARLKEVKGEPNGDDVVAWHFFYTAFLKSTGTAAMKLEFYSGDKYVANQSLTGIDPKSTVLSGEIDITEDDGPAKGKPYTVKLVGEVRGKDVVYATTPLTLN
jgi:hypothetical protein